MDYLFLPDFLLTASSFSKHACVSCRTPTHLELVQIRSLRKTESLKNKSVFVVYGRTLILFNQKSYLTFCI